MITSVSLGGRCTISLILVFCASPFTNSNYEILGEGTQSVRQVVIMDEDNKVFQKKPIKEEEPEDDDYLCKML